MCTCISAVVVFVVLLLLLLLIGAIKCVVVVVVEVLVVVIVFTLCEGILGSAVRACFPRKRGRCHYSIPSPLSRHLRPNLEI